MATPTLQQTKLDLAAHLLSLADRLDCFVRPGAGAALVGGEGDSWRMVDGLEPSTLDLSLFPAGRSLEEIYRYAYRGELCVPWIDDDEEEGNLGPIQALIARTAALNKLDDFYEVICGEFDVRQGLVQEMVVLAEARHELDTSADISLQYLAILAGIDLRSIRNAVLLPPPKGLESFRDDKGEPRVRRAEALRWLRSGRRAFPATVRVGSFTTESLPVPASLEREQVSAFLHARVKAFAGDETEKWAANAAERKLFWPRDKVKALVDGEPLSLDADDAAALADVLHLDGHWLMKQLGVAPPIAESSTTGPEAPSPFDRQSASLEVVLTEAGIRNGYFDMEMRWAEQLFPADAFGDREGNRPGVAVELRFDDQVDATDIRVKSKHKASPRKRFHGFFKRHKASAGDRLRIRKVADRTYTLEFLSMRGANDAAL